MSSWITLLKADSTAWLLEKENPSVRYFTLRDICGRPPRDPELREAEINIMEAGIVPKILDRQKKGGYWEAPEDFYIRTKYRGTVWQLIILAELNASGNDERVKAACEFVLEYSQDRESGGFACTGSKKGGGHHSRVIPCLTGNMVWSLIRLGFLHDPRVGRGIQWITTYQRFDDGIRKAPEGWPYDRLQQCWGKHTCHMGVVKALKACSEIPAHERSKDVNRVIEQSVEYLLKHHIFKRSHDLSRTAKPKWLKFAFPSMWDLDVLETLVLLTKLGCQDSRMQDALDLLLSKQDEQGRWILENTYNGRFQVDIEKKNRPSKWITLNALRVIKGQSRILLKNP